MYHRVIVPLIVVLVAVLSPGPACATNQILDGLIERGFEVAPKEVIKLPPPILSDSMDARAQRQAIESLLAGRYDWDAFNRNSIVSPFLLKISGGERQPDSIGRQVDLYFVAYGSLSKISSENYLQQQLGLAASESQGANSGRVKILSRDDLKKRGLPAGEKPEDPRWAAVESTFLGKVQINLTTRSVKSQTASSVLLASVVDSTFNHDADFPNLWRSIVVDDAGNRQLATAQEYGGLGSYAKATRLAEPAGALFIEYHVAFAEPHGWFHGANLLRSKLPIVAQDMVRKCRRSLVAR